MTRVLSELLGAREPAFRLGLRQLEQASGQPSADIRLGSEVLQKAQSSLRELGLDPRDTTGPELYRALQIRVKDDDAALRTLLGAGENDDELMLRVKRLLDSLDIPKKSFVLRVSAAKRLLKKNPAKKAMRQLGYRSLDSMLKHEPVAQILAAATIAESPNWHKTLLQQYKQLMPTDFEARDITILAPTTTRWASLSEPYIARAKQNIFSFKELGAVVLLPLPAQTVDGTALATTLLSLHAMNDIRATSAYLKLHQVRPDFGTVVANVSRSEPYTQADLAGQRLPWKLVQRYFARNPEAFVADLFEPHVQPEDLHWQPAEHTLARLLERFEFWKHGGHVGLLNNGQAISLNLTDAALNFCNHLPYEQRIVHYFRDHLWHELMLRYMQQQHVEQNIHEQLAAELVDEKVLA